MGLAAAALLAIAAVLAGVFYLGTRAGDGWASSRYTRERDENLLKIVKHEANEKRLEGVNSLLKKQHEELAAERDAADKRNRAEYARRDKERSEKLQIELKSIQEQNDPAMLICSTCERYRKGGDPLSPELCARCWPQS